MMTHVAQNIGVYLNLERHADVLSSAHFPHALSPPYALDAQSSVSAVGQQLGQCLFHLLAVPWLKFTICPPKMCGTD